MFIKKPRASCLMLASGCRQYAWLVFTFVKRKQETTMAAKSSDRCDAESVHPKRSLAEKTVRLLNEHVHITTANVDTKQKLHEKESVLMSGRQHVFVCMCKCQCCLCKWKQEAQHKRSVDVGDPLAVIEEQLLLVLRTEEIRTNGEKQTNK